MDTRRVSARKCVGRKYKLEWKKTASCPVAFGVNPGSLASALWATQWMIGRLKVSEMAQILSLTWILYYKLVIAASGHRGFGWRRADSAVQNSATAQKWIVLPILAAHGLCKRRECATGGASDRRARCAKGSVPRMNDDLASSTGRRVDYLYVGL